MKVDVVVLLRCRYRTWQLKKCIENIRRIFADTNLSYRIYLMPDRPTPEVQVILNTMDKFDTVIVPISDDEDGHRWAKTGMMGLNMGLDAMDQDGIEPRWLYFHDDDEILPENCGEKLEKCLDDKYTLAWTATSLFLWGNPDSVNINVFHHSPLFSRYRVGDRFPTDGRSVQVTEPVHKRITRNAMRKRTLPFYVYDLSAMEKKDRKEQIERFRQSGKDDAYTKPFSEFPTIMKKWEIEGVWSPVDFFIFQQNRRYNGTS